MRSTLPYLLRRAAGLGQGAEAQRLQLDESGGVLLVVRARVVLHVVPQVHMDSKVEAKLTVMYHILVSSA